MSWQEEANTELVELLWGKFNYYNISISYESRSVLVVNLTAQRGRWRENSGRRKQSKMRSFEEPKWRNSGIASASASARESEPFLDNSNNKVWFQITRLQQHFPHWLWNCFGCLPLLGAEQQDSSLAVPEKETDGKQELILAERFSVVDVKEGDENQDARSELGNLN